MESSIDRRSRGGPFNHATPTIKPEEGFQCSKREESFSLRLRNGREAGGCGTTTIGISDSWPMGRVFIWIAISPGSALLSLYDRFIDQLLPSTAKTKSKFPLLSLSFLTN